MIRDTAGDPDKAARAVRDLASDQSVVAIVGPLLSAEVEAAAAVAEEEGVPLLTLTTRREVAKQHSQAFCFRTTPADEMHFIG